MPAFPRVQDIEGKVENAGYQHFLSFLPVFSKGFFYRVIISRDGVVNSKSSNA